MYTLTHHGHELGMRAAVGGGPPLPLLVLTSQPSITVVTPWLTLRRPPHRPCGGLSRFHRGRRRVGGSQKPTAVAMWLRVASSGCSRKIVPPISRVFPFNGVHDAEPLMSLSSQLVPCCRTLTLPDGRTEKAYWLLIYTEPSTGTWREEFFRRKVDAEAAQQALHAKWRAR